MVDRKKSKQFLELQINVMKIVANEAGHNNKWWKAVTKLTDEEIAKLLKDFYDDRPQEIKRYFDLARRRIRDKANRRKPKGKVIDAEFEVIEPKKCIA